MVTESSLPLAAWLEEFGQIFTTFNERTQDSGHVSYGIATRDGQRFFVKTAGGSEISPGGKDFDDRVKVLRRAAQIQLDYPHRAFIPLRQVVEAADGIAVVYDWFPGELLRSPAERREHPDEAHNRFKRLPSAELVQALDEIIDLHVHLNRNGWVVGDFYDGCLMYDFQARTIKFMDLECYQCGYYVNTVGRLPGSTRFMAPEEFQLGATIDSRTTVFNLGKMLEIFLLPNNSTHALTELVQQATASNPDDRPASPVEFQEQWRQATQLKK